MRISDWISDVCSSDLQISSRCATRRCSYGDKKPRWQMQVCAGRSLIIGYGRQATVLLLTKRLAELHGVFEPTTCTSHCLGLSKSCSRTQENYWSNATESSCFANLTQHLRTLIFQGRPS